MADKQATRTWFGLRGPITRELALGASQHLRDLLPEDFPQIVTLCGSTKFKEEFIQMNFELTMAGRIVISVGWFSHVDGRIYTPTEEEKKKLDELHLRKIDLSDAIFVVSRDGYIGESTTRKIEYALKTGKTVWWMEKTAEEKFMNRSLSQ
jgi:hypothetical protein